MELSWKETLRKQMVKQGVTYPALARDLKMSVPGLKKIFQKDDVSLLRLARICQLLELDPAEVVARQFQKGIEIKNFSRDADKYFLGKPRAFHLYWLLAVDRLSLKEAEKVLKLERH